MHAMKRLMISGTPFGHQLPTNKDSRSGEPRCPISNRNYAKNASIEGVDLGGANRVKFTDILRGYVNALCNEVQPELFVFGPQLA
jgi:hypothetical protein